MGDGIGNRYCQALVLGKSKVETFLTQDLDLWFLSIESNF